MSVRKIIAVGVALVVLPFSMAFAAGGVSWGEQYLLPEYPELANYDTQARFTALYGYSVARGGMRSGGFVLGVHSSDEQPVLEGGFIGGISGQELKAGPFVFAANLWTGIGGVRRSPCSQDGTFALFGQLDLELGFSLVPGMRVVGYGGMQAVADILAWQPLSTAVYYTPVAGIRLAWGR
jgi:hypothetical protein